MSRNRSLHRKVDTLELVPFNLGRSRKIEVLRNLHGITAMKTLAKTLLALVAVAVSVINLQCSKPTDSQDETNPEADKPAVSKNAASPQANTPPVPDNPSAPDPKGLVAYYSFKSNANDDSGNNRSGVVHGATPCADMSGRDKNAYLFDGDDYIEISNPPDLTKSATFAAWVRVDKSDEKLGGYVLNKGRNLEHETFSLGVSESLIPWVRVHVDGSPYLLETNKPVAIGKWTHIAGVYDGSGRGLTLYVDGEHRGVQPISGELDQNSESLYFGCDDTTELEMWKGAIDEVRIYNRALEEEEVLQNFNAKSNSVAVEAVGKLATLWGNIKIQ